MNIIGRKKIFLSVSGFLVLASIAAISIWGLKLGIDFTGGSLLEVSFEKKILTPDEAREIFGAMGIEGVSAQATGERGMIFRFRAIEENEHQQIFAALRERAGESNLMLERQFSAIGPTIGAEFRRKSIAALAFAIGAIIVYIAWAFRKVSQPVASWKYGAVAVLALIHDVAIPAGIFSMLGKFKGVEIDALFITALLTILGFSVHDTIVVFDRIRENLQKQKGGESFESIVNQSVNQTIARSINTSLTVLLVLGAVFFWGGSTITYFALTLILGIIFGTYSSIFVASPLLVIWNNLGEKRKRPKPFI